ncbi:hypothetical protein Vretimale_10623 [Volvox reticuliferus]|uniref:Uncharacterized protein n=1 Tax=Volvox reticuliferus TaxID=1737510 RepID=A0A8J4LQW7_9CHLO|nr:hypothetical protein Vretimale_10623 [Volvox reticuliferus]
MKRISPTYEYMRCKALSSEQNLSQEPLKPLELLRKTKISMLMKDIGEHLNDNTRSVGPAEQPALTVHSQQITSNLAPGSLFPRRLQITFSTPVQSQAAGGRQLRTGERGAALTGRHWLLGTRAQHLSLCHAEAMLSTLVLPNVRRITSLIERLHATASAATSRARVRVDAEEDDGCRVCSLEASAALTRG